MAATPHPDLTDIGACVFDAYGTLFDVAAAAARCNDALGDKAGPLAEIWRTKQLQYTWLRTLMEEYQDFWHVTGHALDYAMESLSIKDDALRARLMDLYLRLDAYPEVKGMLEALSGAGVTTAVLTNGSTTMVTAAVRSAGIYPLLDHRISVDRLEIYKPDRRVYQMAVDDTGVEAGRICFMSSNAWDVCGAANFGFKAVWVNRFGQPAEKLPGAPVAELKSLEPLPALLGIG
ncbi:MAG: haloacid dehalogenase type II [Rhodobacterales bacterium]|nr:haloacid dehalogenase type II [Rhodobacterales bacterium]